MTDRPDLDPQVAAVVAEVEREGIPPWSALSVESARRIEDELFSAGSGPDVARVTEMGIPGPDEGTLPVRVYHPDPGPDTPDPPILVFYHGGLWAMGTLDSADDLARTLADRVGAVVVSVDYRLAPEDPFPAAVEDAHAALEWVRAYGESIGGDPDRVGVAGTSAGGNLAAAVALWDRGGGPDLAVQALLYPITDYRFDTASYQANADGPLLTRADVRYFYDQYLRSPVDVHHPFAAPLQAADLDGVAPAVVATAGYDPLRDDGRAYADALRDAGVDVVHRDFPSLCHGFLSLTDDVDRADEAFEEVADEVRNRLENANSALDDPG